MGGTARVLGSQSQSSGQQCLSVAGDERWITNDRAGRQSLPSYERKRQSVTRDFAFSPDSDFAVSGGGELPAHKHTDEDWMMVVNESSSPTHESTR